MAFDLDQFRQAISRSPAVARVFERDKMTSTFTSEEKSIIYNLKQAVKKAKEDNGIGTYSNIDMVIAGGFFTSFFEKQDYKDLDVFILNNNAGLFANCTTGSGEWKFFVNDGTSNYFKNPHILRTAKNNKNKVQFILTDYKTREELIAGFDFVHCTISYDTIKDVLYITRRAYDANKKKELISNLKTEGMLPEAWRTQKFIDRGWMIPPAGNNWGSPLGVEVTAVPSGIDFVETA